MGRRTLDLCEGALDDAPIDLTWITIGFVVAEAGAVLFVAALIVGGIGMRRLGDGDGAGLLRRRFISLVLLRLVVADLGDVGSPTRHSRIRVPSRPEAGSPAGRPGRPIGAA